MLLLDNNLDEPRGFRSPYGLDEGLGFAEMLVSGSAQFGLRGAEETTESVRGLTWLLFPGMKEVLRRIRKLAGDSNLRVMFVDLRQEPHCHVDIATDRSLFPGCACCPYLTVFSAFAETASHEVEVTDDMYLAACWMTQHDFGAAGLSDDEAAQLEQLFLTMLTRQAEIKLGWPHNATLPSQTYILKVCNVFSLLFVSSSFFFARECGARRTLSRVWAVATRGCM